MIRQMNVDQHKTAAAILTAHPRELPDISAADCTAGREHDEAEAASELFTFHCSNSPFDKLRSRYSWSLVSDTL